MDDAAAYEGQVARIQQEWRAAAGLVRKGSAAERLIGALAGAPVVSVSSAADLIGRSFQATNEAMTRLEATSVIRQVNVGRRNRAFEAPAIIDASRRWNANSRARPATLAPHRQSVPHRRAVGDVRAAVDEAREVRDRADQ